jgi:membrane-associated phospholipid phosphatase
MSDIWHLITLIGEPEAWLGICLVLFLLYFAVMKRWGESKQFKDFMFLLVPSIILVLVLAYSMKAVVQVPRPCMVCPAPGCNPYCDTGFAFPSGHAATIFAVFTSLSLFAKRKKYLILYIIPAVVSYSRFALGVHTIWDVLGGAVLGFIVSVFVWRVERLHKQKFRLFEKTKKEDFL